MNDLILPTVVGAGLLDSFNPCAISAALLFIAVMFTLGKNRKVILRVGFFYILSIYLTYFFIGLGLLKTISFFGIPHLVSYLGAFIVILFGVLNLKEYFFPNWNFLKVRMSIKARYKLNDWAYKASVPAAVVMGLIVGVFEFPCSGAVYIAIVSLLNLKATFWDGLIYLLIYNLMFVLPLILIFGLSSNRLVIEKMINWQEKEGRKMHLLLAFLMISLGAIMLIWYL